jgi:hypothetical protein
MRVESSTLKSERTKEEAWKNQTVTNRSGGRGIFYFVKLDEEINSENAALVINAIISKGETTGHAHRVSQSSIAAGALLTLVGRSMFLRSPEAGTTIVHDEHGPIQLPAGSYAVVLQQEFDGLRWRQVLD